jgi:hypothetical protein
MNANPFQRNKPKEEEAPKTAAPATKLKRKGARVRRSAFVEAAPIANQVTYGDFGQVTPGAKVRAPGWMD